MDPGRELAPRVSTWSEGTEMALRRDYGNQPRPVVKPTTDDGEYGLQVPTKVHFPSSSPILIPKVLKRQRDILAADPMAFAYDEVYDDMKRAAAPKKEIVEAGASARKKVCYQNFVHNFSPFLAKIHPRSDEKSRRKS